jgi:hypothetical protein
MWPSVPDRGVAARLRLVSEAPGELDFLEVQLSGIELRVSASYNGDLLLQVARLSPRPDTISPTCLFAYIRGRGRAVLVYARAAQLNPILAIGRVGAWPSRSTGDAAHLTEQFCLPGSLTYY